MKKMIHIFSFFAVLTILVCIFAVPGSAQEPPTEILEASAVILINPETDSVVYEHQSDMEMFPSATTKLMTAIVAYEALRDRMSERVLLTSEMTEGFSKYQSFYVDEWKALNDYVGTYVEIKDLFELLLISGSNDAAVALSVISYQNQDSFVSVMNERAQELKMTSTVYKNATGINEANAKTTAKDVSALASAFSDYAELLSISSSFMAEINVGADKTYIYNRNLFSSSYYGGSYYDTTITGIVYGASSRADACLVAEKQAGNLSYICVVMGADRDSSLKDGEGNIRNCYTLASRLLDYGANGFSLLKVLEKHKIFGEISVRLSRQADYVTYVSRDELFAFLPRDVDFEKDIRYETKATRIWVDAPVYQGDEVGSVRVFYKDELLGEVALVTNNAVSKSLVLEVSDFFARALKNPITVIIIVLLIIGIAARILYRSHIEAVSLLEENESRKRKEKKSASEQAQKINPKGKTNENSN